MNEIKKNKGNSSELQWLLITSVNIVFLLLFQGVINMLDINNFAYKIGLLLYSIAVYGIGQYMTTKLLFKEKQKKKMIFLWCTVGTMIGIVLIVATAVILRY